MTLYVDNQTDWDGRDLRKLIRRVIEHTDGQFDRHVEIYTGRPKCIAWESTVERNDMEPGDPLRPGRNVYHGKATYPPRRKIWMSAPKPYREIDGEIYPVEFAPEWFARVLVHEIAHNRGVRHREMNNAMQYCTAGLDVSYVDGLTVRPKPSVREQIEA